VTEVEWDPERFRGRISPKGWPQLFGDRGTRRKPYRSRGLASVADTQSDASRQNNSETRRPESGKIRGICSPVFPPIRMVPEIDRRLFGALEAAGMWLWKRHKRN
jgi:hypothetical protein